VRVAATYFQLYFPAMAPILAGKCKVDIWRYLPELFPLTFQLPMLPSSAPPRLDGIDFIKKQQWVVTNSVALIYAAIVWVGRNVISPPPAQLLWFLSGLIIVAMICGVVLIVRFKWDLEEAKEALDLVNKYCFADTQYDTLGLQKSEPHRGWQVLAAHLLVCIGEVFVALAALWLQQR
jgi:hypothetical protein